MVLIAKKRKTLNFLIPYKNHLHKNKVPWPICQSGKILSNDRFVNVLIKLYLFKFEIRKLCTFVNKFGIYRSFFYKFWKISTFGNFLSNLSRDFSSVYFLYYLYWIKTSIPMQTLRRSRGKQVAESLTKLWRNIVQ